MRNDQIWTLIHLTINIRYNDSCVYCWILIYWLFSWYQYETPFFRIWWHVQHEKCQFWRIIHFLRIRDAKIILFDSFKLNMSKKISYLTWKSQFSHCRFMLRTWKRHIVTSAQHWDISDEWKNKTRSGNITSLLCYNLKLFSNQLFDVSRH